jgi:uncharacterized Tic20 family protein
MITKKEFDYHPSEHEAEKASSSYLMSLVAAMGGLPFPIINLLATLFFWIANRRGTHFVRWHCLQALFSQFSLLIMNTAAFWWTISIFRADAQVTSFYLSYILTVIIYNIGEMIATIYTAIVTRKGKHVEWWFYGTLTNMVCNPNAAKTESKNIFELK